MWNEVLEDLIVVKRSGQRVDFNASKIAIAIKKSYESVYEQLEQLVLYPERIRMLQEQSVAYVHRHHDYIQVAKQYEALYKSLFYE